jgi:mono/diheme cytochrome c family protein
MKRALQVAALAAAFTFAVVVAASARGAQGHGQTPTPINPAVTFAKNCSTCHGKDGRAKTFKSKHHEHARDLTDPRWQEDATDERIFNSIENGKGKMPAFKRKLTNEQIESLVSYVRGLKR